MPHDFVYAQLGEQRHRRFIKTHTPLDGIPLDPRVTYIVMARHPLDMFVSLCRHNELIGPPPNSVGPGPVGVGPPPHGVGPRPVGVGPRRMVSVPRRMVSAPRRMVSAPRQSASAPRRSDGSLVCPAAEPPGPPGPPKPPASRETLHDALLRWIANDDDPREPVRSPALCGTCPMPGPGAPS